MNVLPLFFFTTTTLSTPYQVGLVLMMLTVYMARGMLNSPERVGL